MPGMESTSLTAGTCPACGGTDVYTTRGLTGVPARFVVAVKGMKKFYLEMYVCLGCGHFEERLPPEQLADNAAAVRTEWKKV